MCTHMRWVRNPNTGKNIFVACGKCPACQQQKANRRARRIKNAYSDGYHPVLVTLTYQNCYIPYIKRSELEQYAINPDIPDDYECIIPVYRDAYMRAGRMKDGSLNFHHHNFHRDIIWYCASKYDIVRSLNQGVLSGIRKKIAPKTYIEIKEKISVPYYKDLQDFIKRLHITLSRHYAITERLQTFQVNELGPESLRSHFHIIAFVPNGKDKEFNDAVITSWPYDSESADLERVKPVKDASKYVASYVNRSSKFPYLFTLQHFRPKYSFSQSLSFTNKHFSLDKVLEKNKRRDFRYPVKIFEGTAKERVVDLPVPKYVINRYFPKFKGYSKLSSPQIYQLLNCPEKLDVFQGYTQMNSDDFKVWRDLLIHKKQEFDIKFSSQGHDLYARTFVDVWHNYELFTLKLFYDNEQKIPITEMYDNISELKAGKVHSDLLQVLERDKLLDKIQDNANDFTFRRLQSQYYEDEFERRLKRKKLNNMHMCDNLSINV